MKNGIRIVLLVSVLLMCSIMFTRAYAIDRHAPAWIVHCPGVKDGLVVYKSGWLTYSHCALERPVSLPSGCTWLQIDGC